jgi:rhombotail lipoprotein
MKKFTILSLSLIIYVMALTACSALVSEGQERVTASSSLVDFLYPKTQERVAQTPQIPVLQLPVNVGIAFIPSASFRRSAISEGEQLKLLETVKKSFTQYEYINRIEIIPSTYLKGAGGFDALDQVSRLYNIDVMALVSYDQLARTNDNNAALLYWTIVGMYVVPASDTSVQTFVDTAVFDVKSRNLLFRAPGLSKTEDRSTAINVDKVTLEKGEEGFELAVSDMIVNLDAELGRFKTRVKEEQVAKVEHREGYSGAAFVWFNLFIGIVLLSRLFRQAKTTH